MTAVLPRWGCTGKRGLAGGFKQKHGRRGKQGWNRASDRTGVGNKEEGGKPQQKPNTTSKEI